MKAIVAVAASILTSVFHMLRRRQPYREPSPALHLRDRIRTANHFLKKLKNLGVDVLRMRMSDEPVSL
jgi:hypothetical protein